MNSLTPNTSYLAHFFTELRDFCSVGSARYKAKKLMNFIIKGTMCEDLTSFEFLNFDPQAYLPYSPFFFSYSDLLPLNVRPLGFNPFWVRGRREGRASGDPLGWSFAFMFIDLLALKCCKHFKARTSNNVSYHFLL